MNLTLHKIVILCLPLLQLSRRRNTGKDRLLTTSELADGRHFLVLSEAELAIIVAFLRLREAPLSMTASETTDSIEPLPYHLAIRDYLKKEESQVWEWYASNRVRDEQADTIRFDLLKSTYRVDADSQPATYDLAKKVAGQLGLDIPITIYQAQNPNGLNASMAYLPNEAHLIFHGPVVTRLTEQELYALLAHEFGHLLLYNRWDGDLLIAEEVLAAMTHDRHADTPHFATARLFSLYREVFCDRIALKLTGSPLEVVSMLVKIETNLEEVNPTSYLKQAKEILSKGPIKTEGISHPEAYIRAHVLELWHEKGAEANSEIQALIEGPPALDELDLTGQAKMMETTRQLLDLVLAPKWLQTDMVLAHARLFFADYEPATSGADAKSLRDTIGAGDQALQDYFCYVLLDFATTDRELEDAPFAHAIAVADALGLQARFLEIATKELRLRKAQVVKLVEERAKIVAAAEKMHERQEADT
jgi:Zn-dependent protease with chaperone function